MPSNMTPEIDLHAMAEALGVDIRYWDISGRLHEAPRETLEALAQSLGGYALAADPAPATGEMPDLLFAPAPPPVIVLTEGHPAPPVLFEAPAGGEAFIEWLLSGEDGREWRGEAVAGEAAPGAFSRQLSLQLPDGLAPGYYALTMTPATLSASPQSSTVIVAPARAYMPPALEAAGRVWGFAVQLYGLRSARNWGIGDFTDLRGLIEKAAKTGASVIGLNPLHALFLDEPDMACPYWPNSRLFLNPLYLDIEAIEDFSASAAAREHAASPEFATALEALRAAELVDYEGVADAKLPVLELLFASFAENCLMEGGARAAAFRAFREERGAALRRFSIFCVIREVLRHQDPSLRYWRNWPAPLQDPASPEVEAFAAQHAQAVLFQDYLQWQADLQLRDCVKAAREAGMPLGLYLDLAVGAGDAAAETWADQRLLMEGWSIGAPPDDFSPLGQDWGSMAFRPAALKARGYAPFVTLLRANMRHAGALRIDHILGLMRLFLVPRGQSAAQGTYVRYPFADLVAILKLESQRCKCLVIGEDLGTVPEGLSESLQTGNIFSYRLLYFHRDGEANFHPPHGYPAEALIAIGTHDLPPFSGWWTGADIAERERLGFYAADPDGAGRERWYRGESRGKLVEALNGHAGGGAAHSNAAIAPSVAAHSFLAKSPARLLMLSFEDMLEVETQANVPSTTTEHPNWRRKLPLNIDAIFADVRVEAALRAVRAERGPGRAP